MVSERLEDLSSTKEIYAYSGVEESLDVLLTGFEARRLYYQFALTTVDHKEREGQAAYLSID